MKWLPFKLSEQEKQAMKEVGKSPAFKSYQREVALYLILLVLAFVFFWKHSNILMLFIVAMATIIAARYSRTLKSSQASYSVGEKAEQEIKRQQELTKKFGLPIIFGIFILFIAGSIIHFFYSKPHLSYKPVFLPLEQEENGQPKSVAEGETAGWKTYRNEDYGFEVEYPKDWHVYPVAAFGTKSVTFSNFSSEGIRNSQKTGETIEDGYNFKIAIIQKPLNDYLEDNRALAEWLSKNILEEKFKIGAVEGYKITTETKDGEKGISWVLPRGEDGLYLIETLRPKECQAQWETEGCKVFRQILAALRFLEQ